jgi:hypothetical protein
VHTRYKRERVIGYNNPENFIFVIAFIPLLRFSKKPCLKKGETKDQNNKSK